MAKNTKPVLVYDLEIQKCIPEKDKPNDPLFDYCQGWTDFKGAGISVCAYGWLGLEGITSFCWDNYPERKKFLAEIRERTVLSGFNSARFDDELLFANGFFARTKYDILAEVRLAAYGSTAWEDQPEGAKYNLDAICKANGLEKTGHGALAPRWWQLGKVSEVLDYCANDVFIEREVLTLLLSGMLIDPNTQKLLKGREIDDYSYGTLDDF